jgi:hypothetical protein
MKEKTLSVLILLICNFPALGNILSRQEKQGHLFQTFGLFMEGGQSAFYNLGQEKYWGELGTRINLFNIDSLWGKPQFNLNADIQASMRYRDGEFLSDTLDVRVGGAGLFTINADTRLAISISHLSGHVLEDVPDQDLIPINIGDESLQVRILHDFKKILRFGGTLKYIFGTAGQHIKKINADQFLEWFPLSERSSTHSPTPYLACGLEEYGFDKYVFISHFQMGLYWGNHLASKHDEILRLSFGGYSGLDPRQKYSHFKQNQRHFFYGGLSYEY